MSSPTLQLRFFSYAAMSARKTLTLVYEEEGFWMFWEGEIDAALFDPWETVEPFRTALAGIGLASRSDMQEVLRHLWFSLYEWTSEGGTHKPDMDACATDLVRFIEAVNAVRPPEVQYL